jgi:hypothetical protein
VAEGQTLTIYKNSNCSPSVTFSSLIKSAFDMPYKTVLVTRGTIQNSSCKILIDPGAEINYISSSFAQRHKISVVLGLARRGRGTRLEAQHLDAMHAHVIRDRCSGGVTSVRGSKPSLEERTKAQDVRTV